MHESLVGCTVCAGHCHDCARTYLHEEKCSLLNPGQPDRPGPSTFTESQRQTISSVISSQTKRGRTDGLQSGEGWQPTAGPVSQTKHNNPSEGSILTGGPRSEGIQ